MQGPQRNVRALSSVGIVHRVDTISRELTVFLDGELRTFDVPVGCAVILHCEPIKLRMVQPKDRVKITHTNGDGLRVARTVEVQPDDIAGRTAHDLAGLNQPARR